MGGEGIQESRALALKRKWKFQPHGVRFGLWFVDFLGFFVAALLPIFWPIYLLSSLNMIRHFYRKALIKRKLSI
jgi:hypothetical protein